MVLAVVWANVTQTYLGGMGTVVGLCVCCDLGVNPQLSSLLNSTGPFWPDFTVFGGFRALAAVWGLAAHRRRLHLGARSHPKPPSVFSSLRSSIATFS